MWRALSMRLLESVPTILVVASISFLLVQLIPGSPAQAILGDRATPEAVKALEEQLGLDQPVWAQYLDSMVGLLQLDLGNSLMSGTPVSELVWNRLPVTISLAIVTVAVSAVSGIFIGAFAAVKGGSLERFLMIGSGLGLALPNFWVGVISVLIFSLWLGLLPATGYVPLSADPGEWAIHLIMPVAVLALVQVASIARQTRSAMSEQFRRDYVRALRASGTPRRIIIWKHALRNAAIPVVTTLGLQFIGVLGGSVIVEQVFALRGIGSLMVESAHVGDVPVLQGIVILTAIIVIAVNLLVELLYYLLNPKVRPA